MTFDKGDRVICIDTKGRRGTMFDADNLLTFGKMYEIVGTMGKPQPHSIGVEDDAGGITYFFVSRFKPVSEVKLDEELFTL